MTLKNPVLWMAALALLLVSPLAAMAGDRSSTRVSIGIGVHSGGGHYWGSYSRPAPVYYAPRPVYRHYHYPAPVYCPPPVVIAPAPVVVYRSAPVYVEQQAAVVYESAPTVVYTAPPPVVYTAPAPVVVACPPRPAAVYQVDSGFTLQLGVRVR